MTRDGDVPAEMTSNAMDEQRREAVLSGCLPPSAGPDERRLAEFVAAVAELGRQAPTASPALAALLSQGFTPAGVGTSGPAPRRSARGGRALALVAGGAAVLVGLGGAASAGVLPTPVDRGVRVLVEVTTPFRLPPAPSSGVTPVPAPTPTATAPAPATTGPTQMDDEDPAQERPQRQPGPGVTPVEPPRTARPGTRSDRDASTGETGTDDNQNDDATRQDPPKQERRQRAPRGQTREAPQRQSIPRPAAPQTAVPIRPQRDGAAEPGTPRQSGRADKRSGSDHDRDPDD